MWRLLGRGLYTPAGSGGRLGRGPFLLPASCLGPTSGAGLVRCSALSCPGAGGIHVLPSVSKRGVSALLGPVIRTSASACLTLPGHLLVTCDRGQDGPGLRAAGLRGSGLCRAGPRPEGSEPHSVPEPSRPLPAPVPAAHAGVRVPHAGTPGPRGRQDAARAHPGHRSREALSWGRTGTSPPGSAGSCQHRVPSASGGRGGVHTRSPARPCRPGPTSPSPLLLPSCDAFVSSI